MIPGLDENLLSVRQMILHGFLLFCDLMVEIFDARSLENLVTRVEMTENRSFPLVVSYHNSISVRASVTETTWLWHRRYGRLNFQSLRDLEKIEMV